MHGISAGVPVGPYPRNAGLRAVDPLAATFGVPTTVPGRRALTSVLDSATFKWAAIAISIVIGLLLLAIIIWAIVTKCGRGKSSPVAPGEMDAAAPRGDVEKGPAAPEGGGGGPAHNPVTAPPVQQQDPFGAPAAVAPPPAPPLPLPPPPVAAPPAPGSGPVPPWRTDPQRLPPGIMLAPLTPPLYSPLVSNPRLASEPPYERLVLISSRVYNPQLVARAVLPNVAYVVYDWKNFTLQELLRYVKKVLGPQKVVSVAVVAPGSKPGTVGLLEGSGTSPEKLATKTELSQFWRVLAGCVALSGTADGRRVDLLACRVVEAPSEGAALLKELWNLTTVPFAAADDALGGYMLCTFMEEPTTKQLSLISSTIPAIDLYFDRLALLGIPPPGAAEAAGAVGVGVGAAAAPLPPGPPPPGAIVPIGTAPPLGAAAGTAAAAATVAAAAAASVAAAAPPPPQAPEPQALAPNAVVAAPLPPQAPSPPEPQALVPNAVVAAPLPPQAPSPPEPQALAPNAVVAAPPPLAAPLPSLSAPGSDVFSRLAAALAARGKSPDAAFTEFDRDGNGQLSTAELTELMRVHLPDASPMDVKHFQAMLDTDAVDAGQERLLSRREFVEGLPENVRIQELVRAGKDDDEVVDRLQEYLTDNEQIMRDTFEQFDENADGHLDHIELQELVASIPGLEPPEKKFILALLYVHDANRDLRISLDELLAALDAFRNKHGGALPSLAQSVSLSPTAAAVAAALPPTAAVGLAPAAPATQPPAAAAATPAAPPPAPASAAAAEPPLPPPNALLAPLGPPGGKLAPLGPLGGSGGGALPPRPGALAPLSGR